MKLDHIAVSRLPDVGRQQGAYQIRAELMAAPPPEWRARFQAEWHNSPDCRRICPDVRLDGSSIFIRIRDTQQVSDTVNALRHMMNE